MILYVRCLKFVGISFYDVQIQITELFQFYSEVKLRFLWLAIHVHEGQQLINFRSSTEFSSASIISGLDPDPALLKGVIQKTCIRFFYKYTALQYLLLCPVASWHPSNNKKKRSFGEPPISVKAAVKVSFHMSCNRRLSHVSQTAS